MNLQKKAYRMHGLIILLFLLSCQPEDYLKGLDKRALFATPTPEEIDQVKVDWAQRDLSSSVYDIEKEVVLKNKSKLLLVSFLVSGYKEYGAVIIPQTHSINTMRMYINGFDIKNPINSVKLQEKEGDSTNKPFILAIPALRGQSLKLIVNEDD